MVTVAGDAAIPQKPRACELPQRLGRVSAARVGGRLTTMNWHRLWTLLMIPSAFAGGLRREPSNPAAIQTRCPRATELKLERQADSGAPPHPPTTLGLIPSVPSAPFASPRPPAPCRSRSRAIRVPQSRLCGTCGRGCRLTSSGSSRVSSLAWRPSNRSMRCVLLHAHPVPANMLACAATPALPLCPYRMPLCRRTTRAPSSACMYHCTFWLPAADAGALSPDERHRAGRRRPAVFVRRDTAQTHTHARAREHTRARTHARTHARTALLIDEPFH